MINYKKTREWGSTFHEEQTKDIREKKKYMEGNNDGLQPSGPTLFLASLSSL
jgi:hypothetical protein